MQRKTILILFLLFTCFSNNTYALAEDNKIYYISTDGVRVRASNFENAKVLGFLNLNDEVKIINTFQVADINYSEIQILKTEASILFSDKYFIATKFLLEKPLDYKEFTGKYFIVLNVASEILRLYERNCIDNNFNCSNKMIMETEVVVGEDRDNPKDEKGKGRSILGSFRAIGWTKFYEDAEGHYPAWYKEGYPEVPYANENNFALWFFPQYMPEDQEGRITGKMRGAFGWYTLFLAPHPFAQWVHGTIGWGEDKDYYIRATKKILPNIIFDPRSSGCTRNNNEAIAYLREMVDIGTPVIKIYAEEKISGPHLTNNPSHESEWRYVLTKNKTLKAGRENVLKTLGITSTELDRYWEKKQMGDAVVLDSKNPLNEIIEVGTYQLDTHPNATPYTPGENMSKFERKLHRNGNVYGIKSWNMSGIYYVDTGILYNYKHPTAILETGGFSGEVTPPWMKLSSSLEP